MSLGLGEEFAGFTIVGRLGAGGMGEVYLAQHPLPSRRDALKVLSAELPADPSYRGALPSRGPMQPRSCGIPSSGFTTVASTTGGCGFRWISSMVKTRGAC